MRFTLAYRYRSEELQSKLVEEMARDAGLGKRFSTHPVLSALYKLPGVVDLHEKVCDRHAHTALYGTCASKSNICVRAKAA